MIRLIRLTSIALRLGGSAIFGVPGPRPVQGPGRTVDLDGVA